MGYEHYLAYYKLKWAMSSRYFRLLCE